MKWKSEYELWKNAELEVFEAESLEKLGEDTEALEDAFYKNLEFGTAGMRGVIGAGINRMNRYTVRLATEGLAQLIEANGEEAKKSGVAIAYDPRHFSKEFAEEAARVLGHHDIKVYLFEELRATPELSFAVRHLQTFAGIMITASHNPPEYNGYKVYGSDGAQMAPESIAELVDYIAGVPNMLEVPVAAFDDLVADGVVEMIGEELDDAYLQELQTVIVDPSLLERMADDVSIVFSPLHGTGGMIGERALKEAGFTNVHLVAEQAIPDPDFSTVASPNPEDAEAFEHAIALGQNVEADVLIATDPDADRLGIAVPDYNGGFAVLTGNQIASLMLDYLIQGHIENGTLPEEGVVVKSTVSGEMPASIARHHGLEVENVLTGFKFIADKINDYEQAGDKTFVFGYEESYGYLIKPFVRDKDAIQALLLVSEMTAFYKERGLTLYEALEELFETYGYFMEETVSIKMEGQAGAEKIEKLLARFRQMPPDYLGDISVSVYEDFETLKRWNAEGEEETIASSPANVLKYTLEDASWVAIRPSGTEPKIKFYVGVTADTREASELKKEKILVDLRGTVE